MSALAGAGRRIRLSRRWARFSRRWGRFSRRGGRMSRKHVRLLIAAGAVLGLAAVGGWLLFRDSSFVAVEHVTVTGAEGSDAPAIAAALDSAAHKMTTLDVGSERLRAAVARFPEVKGLQVSTRFPHGIVIHVIERIPVAVVQAPGRSVVVTDDGMLLPSARSTGSLPVITLSEAPSGASLTEPWARAAARLLGAAPSRLLRKLAEATTVAGHGLVVQIRNGPSIYFGDATQAQAKWIAVLAVLSDPASAGASYIDVTDPTRPAAGTDAQVSMPSSTSGTSSASGTSSTAGTTSTTTSATATTTPATSTAAITTAASSTSTAATAPTTSTTAAATSTTAPTGG